MIEREQSNTYFYSDSRICFVHEPSVFSLNIKNNFFLFVWKCFLILVCVCVGMCVLTHLLIIYLKSNEYITVWIKESVLYGD